MKLLNSLILISIISIIFLYGCTTDTDYVPPTKVESDQKAEIAPSEEQTALPEPEVEEEQPQQTTPKITEFKIGESATDDQQKITLNNVRFTSTINEQNNEFLAAQSSQDEEFVIIDITVENLLSDETQIVSTLLAMTLSDQDGYNYDIDFEGAVALKKGFKDGEILPGLKKRGEIAFLVPRDVTDLKFIYKFDVFVGTSAVFDIK